MGQKVNPIGLRLGINRNWESRWFPAKGTLAENIGEDYKILTAYEQRWLGEGRVTHCVRAEN